MEMSTGEEMNMLCQCYDGFYPFAKLLERLAEAIAEGHPRASMSANGISPINGVIKRKAPASPLCDRRLYRTPAHASARVTEDGMPWQGLGVGSVLI